MKLNEGEKTGEKKAEKRTGVLYCLFLPLETLLCLVLWYAFDLKSALAALLLFLLAFLLGENIRKKTRERRKTGGEERP